MNTHGKTDKQKGSGEGQDLGAVNSFEREGGKKEGGGGVNLKLKTKEGQ